jgi:hypothetical protein
MIAASKNNRICNTSAAFSKKHIAIGSINSSHLKNQFLNTETLNIRKNY